VIDLTPKPGWIQVLKSLFYDGGPSSTRFMFITAGCSASFTVVILASGFFWEYVHRGHADVTFGGVLTCVLTALFGFAANSHNLKHQVDAQQESVASTPVSAETKT